MPPEPGDQRPAAYEPAFLAVEGDIADSLLGADRSGSGDEGGHAAGVVVGSRRAGDRVVVRPDQDLGPPGVAHDHVTRFVHADPEVTGLHTREQLDDGPADGLVFRRPGGAWDADPFDDLPQIILGDGGEAAPDSLGHRLRVGRGGHEPHDGDSSIIETTPRETPTVRCGTPPGRSCTGHGCRSG